MPQLVRVLTADDLRRAEAGSRMDLTPYLAIIEEAAQGGVGGELSLEEDESQRTAKRRLSLAAKAQGYDLTWRKASPGELRFVLARPGEARPGGRQRRSQADRQLDALGGEGAMAAEADALAATTATTEAAPAAVRGAKGGRGRRGSSPG